MKSKENSKNLAKFLMPVFDDKRFWCYDGSIFSTLEELSDSLKKMSNSTFNYHVTEKKNDFINWIYDVIGDIKLAQDLRDCNNKKDFSKKLKARINLIKRNTKKTPKKSKKK